MLHVKYAWEPHVNQDLFISHTVSVHSNMHSSCVATENCMKCGFSYETDCCRNYCEESFLNEFGHFMQMQITDNGRSNRMLHVSYAQEPHVN